jgi:hypothetical protein
MNSAIGFPIVLALLVLGVILAASITGNVIMGIVYEVRRRRANQISDESETR